MSYREGFEYIVCDECGSHIELTDAFFESTFGGEPEPATAFACIGCDNDEHCSNDFIQPGIVHNPWAARTEKD